jgi:hypothetical protein
MAAFGGAALILIVHRRVLPAMGIYIGTEIGSRKPKRRSHQARSRTD